MLPFVRVPSVYSGSRVARRAKCVLSARNRIPYSHKGILLTRLLIARRRRYFSSRLQRTGKNAFLECIGKNFDPTIHITRPVILGGISGPSFPTHKNYVASLVREIIIPQDVHWHYRVRLKHLGSLIKTHIREGEQPHVVLLPRHKDRQWSI